MMNAYQNLMRKTKYPLYFVNTLSLLLWQSNFCCWGKEDITKQH